MKQTTFIKTLILTLSILIAFTICMPVESLAYDGDDSYPYEYYDSDYHYSEYGGYELHDYLTDDYDQELYDEVIKKATLTSKGNVVENCWKCGASRTVSYSWSLDVPDSIYNTSYNVIKHSVVYRNSKSITVKLDHAKKGSVVKVKIGKKTYSKKVGTKKKITIKIKKPKYGSKVVIKVYYKGKVIGKNYWYDYDDGEYYYENYDRVYYAKNIKKGMTKKQVKYLYYWGGPDDTASSSGGWSYWYYDDGSYIGFKKGKVRYWYDAAG